MTLRDHYGVIYRDLVATFRDFAWGSRQTRQACKTGLSCVLAVLLTYFLDIREAYWAGITTLVMTQPNVAASIRKGWMRGAGACCGCFLAVILTGLFLQQHIAYTFSFFALSILGFYLGVTLKSGYFWSYFIMNGVLISMVGMTQPDIAVYIAVHRSAAIAIGVLVSLVINVVLFPDYAHETLKERFVLQRAKTLKWICEIARRYMTADYRMEPVEAQYRDLIQGLRSLRKLLGDAGFEMKLLSGDPELLKSLLDRLSARTEEFYGFFQTLSRKGVQRKYQETHRADMENLMKHLALLEKQEGWSLDENDPETKSVRDILAVLESDENQRVSDAQQEIYGVSDFMAFLEVIFLVRRIIDDLTFKTRESTVSEVAASSQAIFSKEGSDLHRFTWFGRVRSIHIPSFKYAVKGALGIVCVFWFWLWAEIPGGALNMSVAVITVLQQDLMSTTHKGLLRFTGCLVGAAAGYTFLGFQVESTSALCISLFCVVFLFAYIWGGRPGAAYLGLQAGLCYVLATVHDLGATTSLAPPTERLAGIFLGVLFIWTINLLVWPEDLLKRFSASLEAAKKEVAAVGETLVRRFQGEHDPAKISVDVISLESTLQTLLTQGEITTTDAAPMGAWLDHLRLLQKESMGMDPVDDKTMAVFHKLSPGFIEGLMAVPALIPEAQEKKDFQEIRLRLVHLDQELDALVEQLHGGVIFSETMIYKQRLAHVLMITRRLLYRLGNLSDAQSRFPDFVAEDREVQETAASVSY